MGKYFKYAIGEIILVVAGILIALQINNWNEGRKERLKEQELLQQLKTEYQSNLDQLDQKIGMRKTIIASALKLLDYTDNPNKRNKDSVFLYLSHSVLAPTFDPIVNDIISSGRIQLLQNTKLKELLSRWTSEVIQVTEEEKAWMNYRDFQYSPMLSKYSSRRNMMNQYWESNIMESFSLDENKRLNFTIGYSKRKTNMNKLFEVSDLEDHFGMCASYNKIANLQSETLRERIVEILNLIEKDIKQ